MKTVGGNRFMKLWPLGQHDTEITFYEPENRRSDAAVVIFPGGGYHHRAEHEGKGYAEFLSGNGIPAFVVDYRIDPDRFPLPLLDARRGVRFVRANAERFGIDPEKTAVMGSSAGGHLAAMLSTYYQEIPGESEDETDSFSYLPDAQILCYPVILNPESEYSHGNSYIHLLGEENAAMAPLLDPVLNASKATPQAFIWHTSSDAGVNVINSYEYAKALRNNDVPVEMHIFPTGKHGLGLAEREPHTAQWSSLMINWFRHLGWLD